MWQFFGINVFLVLIVASIHWQHSHAIRCYVGGVNSDNIEYCSGNCMKIVRQNMVTRGCSGNKGGEICDAAPYLTVCYCKTDLCNGGSRSQKLTFFSVLPALGVFFFQKMCSF